MSLMKQWEDLATSFNNNAQAQQKFWTNYYLQEKAVYEKLLEKFELKAEECVFIDDSLANVVAAKQAGFHGIHFQNYEQAKAELDRLLL